MSRHEHYQSTKKLLATLTPVFLQTLVKSRLDPANSSETIIVKVIDDPSNGITLESNAHVWFDDYAWSLGEVQDVSNHQQCLPLHLTEPKSPEPEHRRHRLSYAQGTRSRSPTQTHHFHGS